MDANRGADYVTLHNMLKQCLCHVVLVKHRRVMNPAGADRIILLHV